MSANQISVSNIPYCSSDSDVRDEFSKFGKIIFFQLNRGRAKIRFRRSNSASRAIQEMHRTTFEGRKLNVSRDEEVTKLPLRAAQTQGTRLHVSKLPTNVTQRELHDLFEPLGDLTDVKLISTLSGDSRTFAFIGFKRPEQASEAIAKLNGFRLYNRRILVEYADRKERTWERVDCNEKHRIRKVKKLIEKKKMERDRIRKVKRRMEMENRFR